MLAIHSIIGAHKKCLGHISLAGSEASKTVTRSFDSDIVTCFIRDGNLRLFRVSK